MGLATYTGQVKWFNAAKGFGFIGQTSDPTSAWPHESNGGDVFVHYSAIQDSGYKKLDEGNIVEFSVEEGQGGRIQATQVKNLSNGTNARA